MLLLALLALVGICTAAAGGRPSDELRLLLAVAMAYVVGRLAGSTDRIRTVAAAVAAAGTAVTVLATPDGTSGAALAGPLGYGNANGALCLLGVAGALVAAVGPRARFDVRWPALGAALLLAWLASRTGSTAATALSLALLGVGLLLALRPSSARLVPPVAAAAVALAVLTTVALSTSLAPPSLDGSAVTSALSSRRLTLWREAVELVRLAPLSGVGAARFADVAPTAAGDADAAWAHSVWLQQAAETGLLGGSLLLAAGLVAVLSGRRRRPEDGRDPVPALGSAAVAAVLVHASVDYVLHFAVIACGTALLCGLTGARHGGVKSGVNR